MCYDTAVVAALRPSLYHLFYQEGKNQMGKHEIVHVEIPAHDPKASADFYSQLFGWGYNHMADFDYYTWGELGGTGGGYNKVTNGVGEGGFSVKPGEVLIYVSTDDIDASLARAEELGAKIVTKKMEIPTVGWYGVFIDPTGNQIALFTPIEGAGMGGGEQAA
jgi:predicted enzyme related to lactoylglutathione lyase